MFNNLNMIQIFMGIFVLCAIAFLLYGMIEELRNQYERNNKISFKKIINDKGLHFTIQLVIVLGFFSMFNLVAAMSTIVNGKPTLAVWCVWILFAIAIFVSICLMFQNGIKAFVKTIFQFLCENKEIIVIIFISSIVRYVMFGDIRIQRWDAGEYYYRLGTAIDNYDFTWKSIWDNFRLCNHSCIGFTMLYAIGDFLNWRRVKGMLCINLLITAVALYMIYEMYKKYWCKFTKRQALVGTALVSVAPLFLGTCGYLNVDYTMAIFFVFMLYAEYKRQYILLAFWGILLTQTKETGVFIIAGYYIAHFCIWMTGKEKVSLKIKKILTNKITWSTILIAISYAMYVFKLGAFTAWKQNATASADVLWSNSGMNCFGFNIEYIISKLKHFFVMNFAWIYVLIAGICIIWLIRKKNSIDIKNMAGILGGTLGFVIFSCLYITSIIGRYNILPTITLLIMCYCIIENNLHKIVKRNVSLFVWGGVFVVMIIQNFLPIDIVSNNAFCTINTGTRKMLYTKEEPDYYGDYLVSNYQYTWIDKAVDKIFQKVGFDSEMALFVTDNDLLLGSHFNGNGEYYRVLWDTQKKRRVMYADNSTIEISAMYSKYVSEYKMEELPEKAILIFMPYYGTNQEVELEYVRGQYNIIEKNSINDKGGIIEYYLLEKIGDKQHGNLEK